MRIPRFYLPTTFKEGQSIPLDKPQAHYALTVLRLKDQRPIEVFDGKGNQAQAKLVVTGRRTAEVFIEQCDAVNTESPLHTVLLQGISKGDRMDYTIQKSVELGITTIQPIFTERCDVKLTGDRLDKKQTQWQEIAINACEQSNRNVVPTVLPPLSYYDWLNAQTEVSGVVLDPTAENTLNTLPSSLPCTAIFLLIGPEGGLTDDEVLQGTQKGLTPIRLGPRILRTETAGVVILSALQTLWGDFR